MFINNYQEIKVAGKHPLFTSTAVAICVALFVLVNFAPEHSPSWFGDWGYYSAYQVYSGSLWAYLSASLLHFDFLHALFNIYWIYALGRLFEKHVGTLNSLIFWLFAAFVSSGTQFIFSGDTGIGASGVVYALFGYEFISRKHVEDFRQLLNPQTNKILIGWLFVCIALTHFGVLNVANAAHFSGFLFGIMIGWLFEVRRISAAGWISAITAVALVATCTFYAPWSEAWNFFKGGEAYDRSDFAAAVGYYDRLPEDGDYYPYAIKLRAYAKDAIDDKYGAIADWEKILLYGPTDYDTRSEFLNNLAWAYATNPDPQIQNHPKALEYALEANRMSDYRSHSYIDTLAVAYAANGNFPAAIEWQEKAIQIANIEGNLENLDYFMANLELFKNQQPYVEKQQDIP